MDSKKKSWQPPQILMEQDLVARAQDPDADAFLGVLSVPPGATTVGQPGSPFDLSGG